MDAIELDKAKRTFCQNQQKANSHKPQERD